MPDVTEMPKWVEIVDRLGFSIFVALVLMFGFWCLAKWLANNVVLPITQAHLTFIRTACDTQIKQADALEQQSVTLRQMATTQDKQTDLLESIASANGSFSSHVTASAKAGK